MSFPSTSNETLKHDESASAVAVVEWCPIPMAKLQATL